MDSYILYLDANSMVMLCVHICHKVTLNGILRNWTTDKILNLNDACKNTADIENDEVELEGVKKQQVCRELKKVMIRKVSNRLTHWKKHAIIRKLKQQVLMKGMELIQNEDKLFAF